MRSARMLLATLALAALAACGGDPITAPHAVGDVRRSAGDDPGIEETTTTTQGTTAITTSGCAGELVTHITETGIVIECLLRGLYGSGVGN